MPILNRNKCYTQQPKRLIITVPETLPDDWRTDFYERLSVQLKLDDKTKQEVFNHQTKQVDLLTEKELFFKVFFNMEILNTPRARCAGKFNARACWVHW